MKVQEGGTTKIKELSNVADMLIEQASSISNQVMVLNKNIMKEDDINHE